MRIVYLHQYFNTRDAASSIRSYEMARRLAARGHEVHMVTTARDPQHAFPGWRVEKVDGIRVHRTFVPYSNRLSHRQRLSAFATFAARAGARARRLRGDVVFASSTPLTIALPARWALLGRSTPLVFEVRDLWPEVPIALGVLRNPVARTLAWGLQRFAYARADHIVALSPDMAAGVVARGYPSSHVTVIPNSADLDLFTATPEEGRQLRESFDWLGTRPLAVYCGTLGRVNDVGYVVRLAREALSSRPEYRFLIMGDGAERELVRRRAAEAGVLDRNLFLLAPRPKTEIGQVYAAATVCLSTVAPVEALWANSANKVFDAFAAGRPVAINHRGWQADLLEESGAGVVLDPHDAGAALRTLSTLMDRPEQARAAGRAARRLATDVFARDLHAQQLAAVLESVGPRRTRRPSFRAESGT